MERLTAGESVEASHMMTSCHRGTFRTTAFSSFWGTVTPARRRGQEVSSSVTQITRSLCFSLILSLTSLCSCYAKLYSTCQTLKNWQNAFSPPQCHTKYINIYTNELIKNRQCLHVAEKGFSPNISTERDLHTYISETAATSYPKTQFRV